jgi:hypothetical protein
MLPGDIDRRDHTLVDCGCETKAHRDGSGTEVYFCPLHRAAPAMAAVLRGLLELWPLSGYELEAYCQATLVPAARAALDEADRR